jgi:hypothetical protein
MADEYGYGVPSFNTGASNWDTALGSLARGLFPDPSLQSRGLAYGAQAREAILKGDKSITEANSAIQALQMARAIDQRQRMMPQPTYRPSGLPGGAPIMNPPSDIAMTVAGGAAAAPPAPMPPPSMSPVQLYNSTAGADGHTGPLLAGTPPPVSSPSPGAPPAPNTTASDGTVPQGDTGSGPLHPGSVTPPGGGQKYAPPAQANGSPAPVAPGLNLATYVAFQAMAGRDAAQAKQQGLAFLTSAFQNGLIDHNTFAQLTSGMGDNAMYESDQQTGRTLITERGATTREGMRLAQQESQFGRTTQANQILRDPQGNPIVTLPPAPGQTELRQIGPGFSEPLTQQSQGITTTGGGGPYGTGPVLQRQGAVAPGTPGYDANQDKLMNEPVPVVIGGVAKSMPYGEYLRIPLDQRPALDPQTTERLRALAATPSVQGQGTAAAEGARTGLGAATPYKPRTEEEAKNFGILVDSHAQRDYAAVHDAWWNREDPAQLSQEAKDDVIARASDIQRQNPSLSPDEAIARANTELKQAGVLPTPEQMDPKRRDDPFSRKFFDNPRVASQLNAKTGKPVGVFRIPHIKPYIPGAIAVAPPDAQDGDTVQKGNQTGVVRNGFIYRQ